MTRLSSLPSSFSSQKVYLPSHDAVCAHSSKNQQSNIFSPPRWSRERESRCLEKDDMICTALPRHRLGRWCNDQVLVGVLFLLVQIFLFHTKLLPQRVSDGVVEVHRRDVANRTSPTIPSRNPDGFFNGYPVYYRELESNQTIYSQFHCVGGTYRRSDRMPLNGTGRTKGLSKDWTWTERSCRFTFLCFDLSTKEFILHQDPKDEAFLPLLQQRPLMDVSQSMFVSKNPTNRKSSSTKLSRKGKGASLGVAIGGINAQWTLTRLHIGRVDEIETYITRYKWEENHPIPNGQD